MRPLLGASCLVLVLATLSTTQAVRVKPSLEKDPVWGLNRTADRGMLDIPPRRMWGWGPGLHGYCGSLSFQMAGIFHGNWISEQHVRNLAGGELLVGTDNEIKAAQDLHYEYDNWDWKHNKAPQSDAFIAWAKDRVDEGSVPITGWYERKPKGDVDYDHIMPIVGYELDGSGNVKGLIHYDLYLNHSIVTSGKDLHSSRADCSQQDPPVQPYHYCLPNDYDYSIAIKGVVDKNDELFRMKLLAPIWDASHSEPDWGDEDKLHETPVMFTFTAVVTGLTVGKSYTILRFDSPLACPEKNFKDGAYSDHLIFTATNSTMTLGLKPVLSDGTYFYRTVEGTVPEPLK